MIIGIDASRVTINERTGTEAYAYHLIELLIPLIQEAGHELRLYFNTPPPDDLWQLSLSKSAQIVIPYPRLWTHIRLAQELRQYPPDVFFTPAHVIPWSYRGAGVATIHDLAYEYFPRAYMRRQRAYLRWSTCHNARRGQKVIAVSAATKEDVVRFCQVPASQITVVHSGLTPNIKRVEDAGILHAIQQKYAITPPYLLYIGTIQPRKNLTRLVQAYAALPQPRPQLVIAGNIGWRATAILDTISNLQSLISNNIVLPGFVAEEDKAALISGAEALLYPSLYEGFGFPILEGQACGMPVLTANNSSLPEVAGTAALLINGEDVGDITAGISRILTDKTLRHELVNAGKENIKRFTWEKTAAAVLAVLLEASGQGDKEVYAPPHSVTPSPRHPSDRKSPTPSPSHLVILNVPIHQVTMQQTLQHIEHMMAEPRLHQIATANPEFVMKAQDDADFRQVLQTADLCLADGIGLVWASRRMGQPLPERVPGSELVYRMAAQCAQNGWRLFLLGAAPGIAELAGEKLVELYDGLQIAGIYAGSPALSENDNIVQLINESQADVLYVAYGAPRQDKWIAYNRQALKTVRVAIGVGGSLDFIAGKVKRAPQWVQNLKLEWFYRLLQQPSRWRRMLALPRFVGKVLGHVGASQPDIASK